VNILGDIDAVAVAAGMATANDKPPDFRKAISAADAAVLYVSLKVCADAAATGLARSADIAAGSAIRRVRGRIFALAIAADLSFRAGMVTGAAVIGVAIKKDARTIAVEAAAKIRVTHISADSTKWRACCQIHTLSVTEVGKTRRAAAASFVARSVGGCANLPGRHLLATQDATIHPAAATVLIVSL
jgi:hypothetical protein